jgi:hypothetical protein
MPSLTRIQILAIIEFINVIAQANEDNMLYTFIGITGKMLPYYLYGGTAHGDG